MSELKEKYCNCGFPQSSPIPHEHDQTERKQRDDLLEFCKSIIKWQNNLPFQIVGIPTGLYDTGKKIIASAKKK